MRKSASAPPPPIVTLFLQLPKWQQAEVALFVLQLLEEPIPTSYEAMADLIGCAESTLSDGTNPGARRFQEFLDDWKSRSGYLKFPRAGRDDEGDGDAH